MTSLSEICFAARVARRNLVSESSERKSKDQDLRRLVAHANLYDKFLLEYRLCYSKEHSNPPAYSDTFSSPVVEEVDGIDEDEDEEADEEGKFEDFPSLERMLPRASNQLQRQSPPIYSPPTSTSEIVSHTLLEVIDEEEEFLPMYQKSIGSGNLAWAGQEKAVDDLIRMKVDEEFIGEVEICENVELEGLDGGEEVVVKTVEILDDED